MFRSASALHSVQTLPGSMQFAVTTSAEHEACQRQRSAAALLQYFQALTSDDVLSLSVFQHVLSRAQLQLTIIT